MIAEELHCVEGVGGGGGRGCLYGKHFGGQNHLLLLTVAPYMTDHRHYVSLTQHRHHLLPFLLLS